MTNRTWTILAFTALSIAAAFLLPAMPQPTEYHDFADQRQLFGIANFFDVGEIGDRPRFTRAIAITVVCPEWH